MTVPSGIGRYQSVARRILKPLCMRLWDFNIDGGDRIPDGPAILCPNHAAAIDSLMVPAALDRNMIYVGKSEYLDDWKTRRLFPALGMIPIDRRGGDHAKAALDAARQVLENGGLFGIYPEGTRSRSGKLHKGHTGAARLALETGAPIVPVGLLGTADIQPVDRVWPNFGRSVEVRFGAPIEVERYRDRIGDRAVLRELIDEVMYEIQALTGLEYIHQYATRGSAVAETGETAATDGADASESVPSAAEADGSAVPMPAPTEPDGVEGELGDRRSDDVLISTPLRPLEELLPGLSATV